MFEGITWKILFASENLSYDLLLEWAGRIYTTSSDKFGQLSP